MMKEKKYHVLRYIYLFLSVFLLTFGMSMNVMAADVAESSKDGVRVELKTDKDEYKKGEDVQLSLFFENQGQLSVENVELNIILPENFMAEEGSSLTQHTDRVNAGEKLQLDVKAKYVGESNAVTTVGQDESIDTGDSSNVAMWVTLVGISIIVIIVILLKRKKGRRALSLLLCVTLTGSLLTGLSVKAEEPSENTLSVSRKVVYNAEKMEFKASAGYSLEGEKVSTDLITINTDEFSKEEENTYYIAEKAISELSGTLDASLLDAEEFQLVIRNVLDDIILEKDIEKATNWQVDGLAFLPGLNLVTVQAVKDNVVYAKEIEVMNKSVENVNDNLDIDTGDSDGDGLINYVEDQFGSDKNQQDSDGDGLSDYQEAVIIETDPTKVDTDGDGISDYDEDADEDTISNGKEIEVGTNPCAADTDADMLDDGEEFNQYHTDPLNPDTDGDTGKDGWEVYYGFDPLTFNSSFEITEGSSDVSLENPVSAVVDVTVSGDQLGTVEVATVGASENPRLSPMIAGYLGRAVELSAEGNIESATLSMYYDSSLGTLGEEFQPRIYYFNEETGGVEELPDQTVTEGCVSVKLNHFSSYILLNKVELDKVWNTEIKEPIVGEEGEEVTIDVAFVCDTSGSMRNGRIDVAQASITEFIDALEEKDRGALIDFDDDSQVLSGLTTDKEALKTFVPQLDADGYTAIYKGFADALALYENPEEKYGYKMIIILTDGLDEPSTTYDGYYKELVEKAAANDIVVYTIGVGGSVSTSILTQIAENTGGKYYTASTASDIKDSFTQIKGDSVDLVTDTNDDGIPDYYNELIKNGELVLTNGSMEFSGIDFNYDREGNSSADYDGDGLKNGEELLIRKDDYGRVTMKMISNPTLKHSDSDGETDYEEYGISDPLKRDFYASSVDTLVNDDYYYAEALTDTYDDSFLFQLDSSFLAAINGVWNTGELYRDIMIEYFSAYESNDTMEDAQRTALIDDFLDPLMENASDVKNVIDQAVYVKDFLPNIQKTIDALRGSKKISEIKVILETIYVPVLQQMDVVCPGAGTIRITNYQFTSYTKVTLEKYSRFTSLENEKLSKLGVALNLVDATLDIGDTAVSLSKVKAHNQAFERNLDILRECQENGQRLNIRNQAEKIIKLEAEKFGEVYMSSMSGDLAEGALNVLLTVASKNPYVAALVFARDSIAIITGIKEDLKQQYEVLALTSMAYSIKNLIYSVAYQSGDYYYASRNEEDDLERYLFHLAQVRICGENKYCEFQKNEGWFGSKDNSVAENAVKGTKQMVKNAADRLGITLHSSLK